MKNTLKLIGFGIITWIIPLIISLPLYTKDGVLTIDNGLFKSLMIVIGTLTGVIFLNLFFKKISNNYVKRGIEIGIIRLVINLGLDILTLVMMNDMPLSDYTMQVGLRYLSIPITSIGMGYLLKLHTENK
jgi:hypothetical protein